MTPPVKAPSSVCPSPGAPQHTLLRGAVLFLTLAGLVLFVHVFDLQDMLDPPNWVQTHLTPQQGEAVSTVATCKSIFLFIVLAAVLSPIGVPRQALSVLAGYAFGVMAGTLWAFIGLTIGCAGGFFYARFLARPVVQRRFRGKIARLNAFLRHSPFSMALAIRCFPMGNNALTSMLAGVTDIPALPFILGSGIGYLPQTVIFVLLGSGFRIDPLWRVLTAAVLFLLASCASYAIYKRFKGDQLLTEKSCRASTTVPGEDPA